MTPFNNKILLVVLGVLLGGFVLSKMFRSPARESNLKEILLKLDTAKVAAIHIAPAIERKNEIKLVRSGNHWKAENGQRNANIDGNQIKNALRSLAEIRPDRMVTRSKEKWTAYKVDSTGTYIKILAGEEPVEFWVGRSNSGISCVRVEGSNEVYEIKEPLDTYFNKSFSSWRDKSFSRLDPEHISTITFQYPGDSSYVLKLDRNKWRTNNLDVDSSKVATYLNKLRAKTISGFADNFNPPAEASYVVEFNNDSGKVLTVKGWNSQDAGWILASTLQNDVYFSTQDSSFIHSLFPGKKTFFK